jgi:hypothetical protein
MAAHAIGDVGPAFEKDSAGIIFDCEVQAAFEADAIIGALAGVGEHFMQCFGSLARALHQFFTGRRRVADAAFDFVALNFDGSLRREFVGKAGGSFLNRLEFGPPGAPDGDAACVHVDRGPVSEVYWEMRVSFMANFGGLRKRRGKVASDRRPVASGEAEER